MSPPSAIRTPAPVALSAMRAIRSAANAFAVAPRSSSVPRRKVTDPRERSIRTESSRQRLQARSRAATLSRAIERAVGSAFVSVTATWLVTPIASNEAVR